MEKVLIIDFGSQVTQLIARRVREHNVYSEIVAYRVIDEDYIKTYDPKAIILSGGPSSVTAKFSPDVTEEIFNLNIPVLSICYGQQLMCHKLGGKVSNSSTREFGPANVEIVKDSPIVPEQWKEKSQSKVWMSHGDVVDSIPEGFEVIAKSKGAPFAIIANEQKKFYGIQFHPEVTHTDNGSELFANFLFKIANCSKDWNPLLIKEKAIEDIKEIVKDDYVICGVSGGVDSSVVATLIHKAIGKQLIPIFIDTGLLRKDEAKQVVEMFEDFHIDLIHIDASDIFLSRLSGIDDPEKKRKIIGNSFVEIFEKEAKKVENAKFLAQGTLYPDVIESVSIHGDAAVTIKSHHNVGGLPEKMDLKLLEPVRELFKDEVRQLGRQLDMPEQMIKRHPFPGPGLAIRIPGEVTVEKVKILQEADSIYIQSIKEAGLYDEIWQAFTVLLPVKSVGVMGDNRTYEYVCALRAVTSTDGMTADFYDFSHDFLRKVSTEIINSVKGINRVTYDITPKPPGTIEWE